MHSNKTLLSYEVSLRLRQVAILNNCCKTSNDSEFPSLRSLILCKLRECVSKLIVEMKFDDQSASALLASIERCCKVSHVKTELDQTEIAEISSQIRSKLRRVNDDACIRWFELGNEIAKVECENEQFVPNSSNQTERRTPKLLSFSWKDESRIKELLLSSNVSLDQLILNGVTYAKSCSEYSEEVKIFANFPWAWDSALICLNRNRAIFGVSRLIVETDSGYVTLDGTREKIDIILAKFLDVLNKNLGKNVTGPQVDKLLGLSKTRWNRLVEDLPPELRIIVIGTPGKGYSLVFELDSSN